MKPSPSFVRWWKRVSVVAMLLGMIGLAWSTTLSFQYKDTLPTQPDSSTGRIYPFNFHGYYFYQTREERDRMNAVWYSTLAMIVVAIVTGITGDRMSAKSPPQVKISVDS